MFANADLIMDARLHRTSMRATLRTSGTSWAGRWDPTLERKAGGVFPVENLDLGYAAFHISNASSVMALVRAVVGYVMRCNSVPESLATYFKSLRIT